ncbi:MAG: thioredoxin domain-containing protein [Candidatus Geothermarchaeales archaeon]
MPKEYVRTTIPVIGMDCYSCVLSIEKALKKLDGVEDARVNFLMKKVLIDHDPQKVGIPLLEKTIEGVGYRIAYKRYEGILDKLLEKIFGKRREEPNRIRLVQDHNFDDFILKSNKPVVVEFMSPDCPACRVMASNLEQIEDRFREEISMYQMDITRNKRWETYNILSVPTLIYVVEGREVERQTGLAEVKEIVSRLEELTKA